LHRTANQLEAELVDLVELLAKATGRTIKWKGGSLFVGSRLSEKQRSSGRFRDRFSSTFASKEHDGTYIIHEPDASIHALRLKEGTIGTCHVEVPTSSEEMKKSLKCVAQSACVMLLQTRSVLEQPWALLAVFHAILVNVPVVCVVVAESGYDFGEAKLHLEHLTERLDEPALEQISRELSRWDPPKDMEALGSKLSSVIPHIISVTYNPNGTSNELIATMHDVKDKQRLLQARGRRRSTSIVRPSTTSTQVV
jgi:hypothetical protein